MGLLLLVTAGLVFWICGWAFGIKSFDAFLVTAGIGAAAAAIYVAEPFLRQLRGTS